MNLLVCRKLSVHASVHSCDLMCGLLAKGGAKTHFSSTVMILYKNCVSLIRDFMFCPG